jgi:hypothetical protein
VNVAYRGLACGHADAIGSVHSSSTGETFRRIFQAGMPLAEMPEILTAAPTFPCGLAQLPGILTMHMHFVGKKAFADENPNLFRQRILSVTRF